MKGFLPFLKEDNLLAYLSSLSLRITEIHRVLKKTGTFFLHCDSTASHYLKLILDAVFVSQGGEFKNEIFGIIEDFHIEAKIFFLRCMTSSFSTLNPRKTTTPL